MGWPIWTAVLRWSWGRGVAFEWLQLFRLRLVTHDREVEYCKREDDPRQSGEA